MTGKNKGFTLIELMVILLIISVLAAIVTPMVSNSITKAHESALREDLFVMRKLLDDYYADTGNYPTSLSELVDKGYMQSIPIEPFTKDRTAWRTSYDASGGITDVHSAYDGQAKDGSYYRDW